MDAAFEDARLEKERAAVLSEMSMVNTVRARRRRANSARARRRRARARARAGPPPSPSPRRRSLSRRARARRRRRARARRHQIEYRVECQILQALHAENRLARRFPIGKEELIRQWSRDDVASFHATHYRPENALLYLIGDVDADDAQRVLGDVFGRIPAPGGGRNALRGSAGAGRRGAARRAAASSATS